ncbi:MAG: ribosome biogenesis GTP-binding protein YihA/YsxC [Candidatus Muirbacterium halophilum]|nr:ribosome biogenesis GTP-binding protein YihA/YsxC [Candidatus Muirbacterium halophilum]MCK9475323.1 ribosome biogenesis GTP-binding protein YihA/YsxC [Candidatus Muirbacterium halophilum]
MKIKDLEFIQQAKYKRTDDLPEYAFVGRSNAGKSSIINEILNWKINRVSKRPGCTRLINKIKINDSFYIVDLPGYGFAKVALSAKKKFSKLTENYIKDSDNLRLVFIIMDMKVAPTELDIVMIQWLKDLGRNFVLVFNKSDKIPKNKLQSRKNEIWKILGFKYPEITVSVLKNENLRKIEDYFFKK